MIPALVRAQGEEGLRFALSRLGQTMVQGHPSAAHFFTLREAQSLLGEDVESMIKAWAIQDPFIRHHLDGCEVSQQKGKPKGRVDASYEKSGRP